jgi:hypothetical protein
MDDKRKSPQAPGHLSCEARAMFQYIDAIK